MIEALTIFGLVLLQNASFTLVSRARNSKSIIYHIIAASLSNGLYLLVFKQLSMNLDSSIVLWSYWIAAIAGSVLMHYIAMRFFEKPKKTTP